jgi:tetratricopeptide (TPR) repeat protein
VAVLPFQIIGADAEMSAFGDGLTETLSAKLGQFTEGHSLQVIPTQQLRDTGATTAERARREFGVNLVVEGSLHKLGSATRVNFVLVDPATSQQLRAATITASASDTFSLEEQVVNVVLSTLAIELEPPERLILFKRGTAQSAAYDYYLRGRGYMQDYDKQENIESAIVAFNKAIDLDQDYALAYASLGEANLREFQQSHDRGFITKANGVCHKAVSLDPDLAQGHYCLGRVFEGTGQYERAVKEFELAVVLDPSSDEAYRGLAHSYSSIGKPAGAEATYQRAISLRPHYWAGYSWLGTFYFNEARYADAVSMFSKVVELSPANFRGYSNLEAVYVLQGLYLQAINELDKSIAIRPTESAYANLGTAYFGLRRFEDAVRAYEQGLKLDDKDWLLWGNLGDARYWISIYVCINNAMN